MEFYWFISVLLFAICNVRYSVPKFHLLSSAGLKNLSCSSECSAVVIRFSKAKNVAVVCGLNAAFCPTKIVQSIPEISWTLFHGPKMNGTLDSRDICLLATDNIASSLELFNNSKMCHQSNILLTFPSSASDRSLELKTLFDFAWKRGIVDIAVVLADPECRVYTYVPFREGGVCYDTSPVLLTSWDRNRTCTINDSATYFPQNKISSLHGCELELTYAKAREAVYRFYKPILAFIEAAMNASVKPSPSSSLPLTMDKNDGNSSKIMIALRGVHPTIHHSSVVPSYFILYDSGYAVPSWSIASILWFRIFNELSKSVWLGLFISLIVSVLVLYAFTKGKKDFVYVTLFVVKPLLGSAWSDNFLPWHARIYLALWFLFCHVLDSCYMCSLLSDLTKPFNEDTIKTLQDLLKTNMPIVTSISRQAFESFYETDPLYNPLKEKLVFVNMSAYFAMLNAKRNDTAYIINSGQFDVLFINMSFRMLPKRFIGTFAVPITMSKPTPYERFFQISVLRAISAGAAEYLVLVQSRSVLKKLMYQIWDEKGSKPLPLNALAPVFVLWSAGCALASLAFIIENCCQRFSR